MMESPKVQTAPPFTEVTDAANPFDLLPNEIVTKILGLDERYHSSMYPLLPNAEDVRRLRATCKLFRSLVSEAGTLYWIFKEEGSVTRFNTFISSNLAARLKRIWLRVHQDYTLDLTYLLQSSLSPFVETLESVTIFFNQRNKESRKLLQTNLSFEVSQSWTKLRHLVIRPEASNSNIWRAIGPPSKPLAKLTILSISCLCMQSSELQAMLPQFPALQYLSVGFKRLNASLSSNCFIESSTLKTLRWFEEGGTNRLGIICPSLRELVITTEAQVSISCPFLEKLDAYQLPTVDAVAAMRFLTELSFSKVTWSTICKILKAAPHATKMSIGRWHEEALQPLQMIVRLCPNLKLLQLDFEAWSSTCLNASSNPKRETKLSFCRFAKLQHIDIFLSDLEGDLSTRDSVASLRTIAAACDNLRRMDVIKMLEGDRKDEIEIGLQKLSKEFPSCLFVLQDLWDKSILTFKANS